MKAVLLLAVLLAQQAVERNWRQVHSDGEATVSIDTLNMAVRLRDPRGFNAAQAQIRVEYHTPPASDPRRRVGIYDLYFNCDARTFNIRRWSHQDSAGQFYDTGWTYNRSEDALPIQGQTVGQATLDVACA